MRMECAYIKITVHSSKSHGPCSKPRSLQSRLFFSYHQIPLKKIFSQSPNHTSFCQHKLFPYSFFFEVQCTHNKAYHFKVVFSISTKLYSHNHYLILECFHYPPKKNKQHTHYQSLSILSSQLWQSLLYFFFLFICPVILQNGIIYNMVCHIWLLSLTIMLLRFIYIIA